MTGTYILQTQMSLPCVPDQCLHISAGMLAHIPFLSRLVLKLGSSTK